MVNSSYKAYFKANSLTANSVMFQNLGYNFTMDISTSQLHWYNSSLNAIVGMVQEMNPQATQATTSANSLTYSGAWINTNLQYQAFPDDLKETLVITGVSSPSSSVKPDYLQYVANCYYNSSLTIYANGVGYLHPSNQKFVTNQRIDFNDASNNTIFYLRQPLIYDSNQTRKTTVGEYSVTANNGVLIINIRVPKTFIDSSTFPVYLDPTIGQITGSSNYGLAANSWVGLKITMPENGAVTQMHVYMVDGGTPKMAIYTNTNNAPGTLVYGDNSGVYTDGNAWVNLIGLNVVLTEGNSYWLLVKTSSFESKLVGSVSSGNSSFCAVTAGLYDAAWASSAQALSGNIFSIRIYANYTASAASSDITQYVNGQNSQVDSVADVGTHSNFAAQQAGPDLTNDTLTEANVTSTWGQANGPIQNQYASSGIDSTTIIGTSSNFTAQKTIPPNAYYDTLTEGVNTTTTSSGGTTSSGSSYNTEAPLRDVILLNFTAPTGANTITTVSWYGRAASSTTTWCGMVGTLSGTTFTKLTNGQTANASVTTGLGWQNASFATPPTITGGSVYWILVECGTTAQIRLYYSATTGGYEYHGTAGSWSPSTITVSHSNNTNYCIYSNITLNQYSLNMQQNWTSAAYNSDEANLCVDMGAISAGSLALHYWNGSSWIQLSSGLTASAWNNFTIKSSAISYLSAATFTIRFSQMSLATTAKTFQIYCVDIYSWNSTNYNLMLEENFTSVPTSDYYGHREVCVFMGPYSNGEALKLDIWNTTSTSWTSLSASLTTNSWNNFSIINYATYGTITVRFQGATETQDSIQSSWQKDCLLLHLYNASMIGLLTFTSTTLWSTTTKWTAKTSSTYATTTTWSDTSKLATKAASTFSSTSSWSISKYKWTAKNSLSFSATSSWSLKNPWVAKSALTFAASTMWSAAAKWGSKISAVFSVTSAWSNLEKWTAKISPSFTSSTTWGDSGKWIAKIGTAFISSTSWNTLEKWTAKITTSFSTVTSWTSIISATHISAAFLAALTFSTSTSWNMASKWMAQITDSFSTMASFAPSLKWTAFSKPTFGASLSLNINSPLHAFIQNSFASTITWSVNPLVNPITDFFISLGFQVATSWNMLTSHWGLITGGGYTESDLAAVGIIAALLVGSVGFSLTYVKRRKQDDD